MTLLYRGFRFSFAAGYSISSECPDAHIPFSQEAFPTYASIYERRLRSYAVLSNGLLDSLATAEVKAYLPAT